MASKTVFMTPVNIELRWPDGAEPVDQVTDDWGTFNVYLVEEIAFDNPTGTPWEFAADDTLGRSYSFTIPAAGNGEVRPPPPKRFATYSAAYHISRR